MCDKAKPVVIKEETALLWSHLPDNPNLSFPLLGDFFLHFLSIKAFQNY